MRCEDVTRNLADPTTATDLAGHLASCPSCALWSQRAARLDRIWDETRPADPSAVALDDLWARAWLALNETPAPSVIKFKTPTRRRAWWPVALGVGLAQAAVILIAAVLLLREQPRPVAVALKPPTEFTVESDQTVIVRIGDDGHRVEVLDEAPLFETSSMAYTTPHDVFSAAESMVAR